MNFTTYIDFSISIHTWFIDECIDLSYEWQDMYYKISLDNESSFTQKIGKSKIFELNYKHLTYFHIQINPIHKITKFNSNDDLTHISSYYILNLLWITNFVNLDIINKTVKYKKQIEKRKIKSQKI